MFRIETKETGELVVTGDVDGASFTIAVSGPWRDFDYRVQWATTMYTLWDVPAYTGYLFTTSLEAGAQGQLRAFRVHIDGEEVLFEDMFLESPWNDHHARRPDLCFAVADAPCARPGELPSFRVATDEVRAWEDGLIQDEEEGEDPGAGPCVVPPAR